MYWKKKKKKKKKKGAGKLGKAFKGAWEKGHFTRGSMALRPHPSPVGPHICHIKYYNMHFDVYIIFADCAHGGTRKE